MHQKWTMTLVVCMFTALSGKLSSLKILHFHLTCDSQLLPRQVIRKATPPWSRSCIPRSLKHLWDCQYTALVLVLAHSSQRP